MHTAKTPNTEPIPGYRLLEPLGRGGFGEVWKCEAPGGLPKAVKFVGGAGDLVDFRSGGAEQELRALQLLKTLRHPFLLTIERVEIVDGELAVVMELADRSLHDVLREHRAAGRAGIPRAELLHFLTETAEVLDLLAHEHGLQHLDVKPHNLFVVGRHVKVGDFGLLNRLAGPADGRPEASRRGAISPIYAAPETFNGSLSAHSDQYSLAVTYHELLTGCLPFRGKSFRELALQHTREEPDLARLPEADRPALARALAKAPDRRYPTCTDFIHAMATGRRPPPSPAAGDEEPPTPDTTRHDIAPGDMASTVSPDAGPAPGPALNPATGPYGSLTGYQFLECLTRLPGRETWKAKRPDGRPCVVKLVFGGDALDGPPNTPSDERPVARLNDLRHEALLPSEIIRTGPHQLALIQEEGEGTLADRFRACRQAGETGVPRAELLGHLRRSAEALDLLYRNHRLQHLALTPRCLVLRNGRADLADFGLTELFWDPAGHDPAALNTRYAAPELFDGQPSQTADQYSLALIYLELLTGNYAFRNLNRRQMAAARLRGRPDLGTLPPDDRLAVLRALDPDPDARFPTCTAFVTALEAAGRPGGSRPGGRSTRVIRALKAEVGEPPRRPEELLAGLVACAAAGAEIREERGLRYRLRPGPVAEYCCFARVIPGTLPLRLQGFRDQWRAREEPGDARSAIYRVPLPGTLWQRCRGKAPELEMRVHILHPDLASESLSEVSIVLRPLSPDAERRAATLQEMGPSLLETLRAHLQAPPERRSEERFRCDLPVGISPALGEDEAGDEVVGQLLDVSPHGMGLVLPCRPPEGDIFVRLEPNPDEETLHIRGRVVRVRECADGRYQVGIRFDA